MAKLITIQLDTLQKIFEEEHMEPENIHEILESIKGRAIAVLNPDKNIVITIKNIKP